MSENGPDKEKRGNGCKSCRHAGSFPKTAVFQAEYIRKFRDVNFGHTIYRENARSCPDVCRLSFIRHRLRHRLQHWKTIIQKGYICHRKHF